MDNYSPVDRQAGGRMIFLAGGCDLKPIRSTTIIKLQEAHNGWWGRRTEMLFSIHLSVFKKRRTAKCIQECACVLQFIKDTVWSTDTVLTQQVFIHTPTETHTTRKKAIIAGKFILPD